MDRIKRFWDWFRENQHKYLFINEVETDEKERLLDDFLAELHKYCSQVFFQIGGTQYGVQELIITAEGKTSYFDRVEDLVFSSPVFTDWKVIAFKPPMGPNFVTRYNDIEFDPQKSWFIPMENVNNTDLIGLRVGFPDFDYNRRNVFLFGAWQVLDTMLGEKAVSLDINYVDVGAIPNNPEQAGFIPLAELREYIEWKKNAILQENQAPGFWHGMS